MIVILYLFLALSAFAQEFQFRLEGSFPTTATPDPINPTTVNYSISWNETATTLQGIYQDNYFTQGAPKTVAGTVSTTGRTFNVILSEPVRGVRQITLTTPQTGVVSGSVSMNTTTRDNVGGVIDNHSGFSLVTVLPAATAGGPTTEQACIVGFGALTKMCGLYNGTFNEIADNRNRCDLLSGGNPRLELSADTVFRLFINYVPGVPNPPVHNIGPFLPSPQTSSINVTSRSCGPLPGTTFLPGNCRTLNLSGIFSDLAGTISFSGTYTISDDVNGDSCSYSMLLTREVTY